MNTKVLGTKLDILISEIGSLRNRMELISTDISTLNDQGKEFIDEETLQKELGVSRTTIYRLEKELKIRVYRINGKGSKKFFKRSEVYKLLENGL